MSKALISVIIPTYHRNDLLASCLDWLSPSVQLLSADQYEVIVSDDGTHSTAENMIKELYAWVRWVQGPRQGSPAANRNCGASHAIGEWLVFTDDDCLPVHDWLVVFSVAMYNQAIALEGAIHPDNNKKIDMSECPINLTGGCFWTANVAVRRDIFIEVNGFDEGYPAAAYEDIDLYLRLQKIGEIPFISEAKVIHPVRVMNLYSAIKRIPKICASWAYHTKKHKDFLGYKTDLEAALGILSNGRGMFYSLKQLHIQECISKTAYLIIGAPLTYYYRINIKADSLSTVKELLS